MVRAADKGVSRLYHYERFNPGYLGDTLINRHVHFSSPEHFNDPWDCRPWFDPAEVADPTLRLRWVRFLERHVTPRQEDVLLSQGVKWRDDVPFLTKTIEKMTATMWQLNAERWRIYCLTTHPSSSLMWAHYGDRHRGICFEFDASVPIFARALQVVYRESLPAISASSFEDWGTIASMLLDKSSEWLYEDEYRILARDVRSDALPTDFLPITDKDFLHLPEGALTAVIAGCSADLATISSIVRARPPRRSGKNLRQGSQQIQASCRNVWKLYRLEPVGFIPRAPSGFSAMANGSVHPLLDCHDWLASGASADSAVSWVFRPRLFCSPDGLFIVAPEPVLVPCPGHLFSSLQSLLQSM